MMIRRRAASLCVLAFLTADALLIGAASLDPRMPLNGPIAIAPLTPPPSLAVSEDASPPAPAMEDQVGVASWYGEHWQGRVTASGKPFDDKKLTAAHRTLPLNTQVRVTNLKTGRSVKVTITDRGPYVHGRVIDLSKAAAKKLGMVKKGLVPVEITKLAPPAPLPPQSTTKVASLDVQ
jgi:rare lipoprotein A